MRLRDLRQIVETNQLLLTYQVTQNPKNTAIFFISKHHGVVQAVENFRKVGLFSSATAEITAISTVYGNQLEQLQVDQITQDSFVKAVEKLKASCTALVEVLETVIPRQSSDSLSIRLPSYSQLSDLRDFFEDFNTVVSQSLLNEHVKAEVQLVAFDTGSLWLDILLGGQLALSFFASLVWSAAVIRKKIVEGQLLEQQVRSLKIKNESLEDIRESSRKHQELLLKAESENLIKQLNLPKPDHEYEERLKHSIQVMAELIAKGTEVHPSLTAPEDVKNLLPDFKKLDSLQSKIKQIEE